MKLRYNFVVQNVSGKTIAVAVGQDNEKFNGMIKLNESGELIFRLLSSNDYTEERIISQFAAKYGIAEEAVKPSVSDFIDQLRQNCLLTE